MRSVLRADIGPEIYIRVRALSREGRGDVKDMRS